MRVYIEEAEKMCGSVRCVLGKAVRCISLSLLVKWTVGECIFKSSCNRCKTVAKKYKYITDRERINATSFLLSGALFKSSPTHLHHFIAAALRSYTTDKFIARCRLLFQATINLIAVVYFKFTFEWVLACVPPQFLLLNADELDGTGTIGTGRHTGNRI